MACLFAFLLLWTSFALASSARTVSVADFGAVPDDGLNDADALRRAAAYCRSHPGTTLRFPAGVYDFVDAEAQAIERNALSGRWGGWWDVQNRLFTPRSPYVKALDFTGCRNLTIRARGAHLRLDGWYEVISLVGTRNVVVDGLTISYRRPAATELRVTAVAPDGSFELGFNPNYYTHLDSAVVGRAYAYDAQLRLITYRALGPMTLTAPGRVHVAHGTHPNVGDVYILRNGGHYRPCIMIKESDNVCIKHVHIASHCGMGIVGHQSSNITVAHCAIVPLEGHVTSTWTDATHFTSCSGNITIHHTRFAGSGDDCTNIHNYYYHVYPQPSGQVELRIEGADLHALSLDFPHVGDSLVALSRTDMTEFGRYAVTAVDTSVAQWRVSVRLDRSLSGFAPADCYMANITRTPNVNIHHNHSTTHLGRSYLIKSNRRVRIHHNYIEGSNLSAIKLGGEISWHEAGPVADVVISRNTFVRTGINCGANDGAVVRTSTESPATPPQVNRNITFRRNRIVDAQAPHLFYFQDACGVRIERNAYDGHPDPVLQTNSSAISVRQNKPLKAR